MTVRRLTAVDAQMLWMSAHVPNDEFLLYGFAGVPAHLDDALRVLRDRAADCLELTLHVQQGNSLAYPRWVAGRVGDEQVIVHHLEDSTWAGCLTAVCALADAQLDLTRMSWRLHVFTPVAEVPGATGAATVAVLQMSHALGDGHRMAALAGVLFGRDESVPAVAGPSAWLPLTLPVRGWRAARAHRQLLRDTTSGQVPPQVDSRPALLSNSRPTGPRQLRTVIRHRGDIAGPTVTVGVLAAVADALSAHVREAGGDPATLGAEVPMASPGARRAHNHFGNVAVALYPCLDRDDRIARIAQDLADRRRRASHPAILASRTAFAAVPAPLLRWGVGKFDPEAQPSTVIGNTVVSSVNRGGADLHFGDAPVVITAGCPTLSPVMGLTHGVHGIGDTVAVSVHGAESAVGDVDAYIDRLDAALS